MIKDKIKSLIQSKPKHFSRMINSDHELKNWVIENSTTTIDNFAAKIYSALENDDGVCSNGNTRRFISIADGFGFCGKTKSCLCAKRSVSEKVSSAKNSRSVEMIEIENAKRKDTNLKKYGVDNVGKTAIAKDKHKQFYQNTNNIEHITQQIKNTKLERYGDSTYNNRKKAAESYLEIYGVNNPLSLQENKDKRQRVREKQVENKDYLRIGYERFKSYVSATFDFELLTPFDQYQGIQQKDAYTYAFRCQKCSSTLDKKFYHAKGLNCQKCNPKKPSFTSNEEQQVFDYINKELSIEGKQGDKSIINPYELDMVFETHKIAVEYCGLYWHSELSSNKHKKYHQTKMMLANAKGYRLITIFSDEWNKKQDIVKARLAHLFNRSATKLYARKTEIKEVSAADSKIFLDTYHIQGNSHSPVRYGLYHSDDLVALMTFSKPRLALNSSGKNGYELVRYATNGTSVVGGASKLLRHFISVHNPSKIITYADLRYSDGNLYDRLGFSRLGMTGPGYWYVDNYISRHHRFNFNKQRLVKEGHDRSKTEWEIMQTLGYDRIWDCGNLRFELNL